MHGDAGHIPVMLDEVVAAAAPGAGDVVVDGTFGAGGYCRGYLEAADCKVVAIDRDPDAAVRANGFLKEFPEQFRFVAGAFGDMHALLEGVVVDAVILDIGVSSFQLDEADRGFSFLRDGPLDMRMSRDGETAADIVNGYSEEALADIIYAYGEERKSRRIAAAIVRDRADAPFETTRQLADMIERVLGRPRPQKGAKPVHPATRTFQALRIKVNDELGELERGLRGAEAVLSPGGRLVVVTFHSLEDRIVKAFMAERAGKSASGSRHMPMVVDRRLPSFALPRPHLITPSDAEVGRNPRSRSAKLRVAVRTEAEPWQEAA